MRLAVLRTPRGARVHLRTADGYVDLADASGKTELAELGACLADWPQTLAAAESLPESREGAIAPQEAQLAPTVASGARVFCVGRNYAAHIEELQRETPEWPETFLRLTSAAVGAMEPILVPDVSRQVDYEGELAVIIGRGGRHVAAADAAALIAGYTIGNDVSIRDWQLRGKQWTAGKNFDDTLPIGPELVSADELDANDLELVTKLNGETVQSARTSQMLLGIGDLIEFFSSFTALVPGDVILTGTPGGVGMARQPQLFLEEGDVIEVAIEGLGTLSNPVRRDGQPPVTSRWTKLANTEK